MLGMARYALYFRGDGPSDEADTLGFAMNSSRRRWDCGCGW